jgi:hypothetical protein
MKTETESRQVQCFTATRRLLQILVLSLLGLLAASSASAVGDVVISQVYGGGGGSGYYKYDYVELYNPTDTAATLTGWSIQYASASGAFSSVYPLPAGTVIPAGSYLLVQVSGAGTSGLPFPVPADLTTTALNISQASGKVALANITTALGTVTVLPDSRIVDFVGFGAANLGEGGTKVNNGVALNNMQGCVRKMAGFRDTDDNNLDFDVVTPPVPRNNKAGKLYFFPRNWLPPTNGMYVSPAMWHQAYANGIIISNLAHRIFTGSIPPPPPGVPASHTFGSTVEFEISINGGLTFAPVTVPGAMVTVALSSNSTVGGYAVYTNVMTSLTISGGGLPSGVIIRQNPGTNSPGQTRIQTIPGGYMVSSFFDIFTQLSTDGGLTWQSATNGPIHMELKPDPALVTATTAPRTVLPMPNGQYISPTAWHQLYASGIVIKDIRHKLFMDWVEPPTFGYTNTHTFNSQLDFQLSTDGGATFTAARAPATMTVKISNVRGFQGRSTYDTEVTQLDISGGDLPVEVMIRESPTKASQGGTSSLAGGGGGGAGGGAAISSFFDIFTEVSTDSGGYWNPATNGPAHMELQRIAPANLFPDNLLPSLTGEYISPQQWHAYYTNGIVITNVVHRDFNAAIAPPSPGGTLSHTFMSEVDFDLSQDGGLTYNHTTSYAAVGVQITTRTGDDGTTVYYDTEMTQLSIGGGGLPSNIQIRESPTKASSGRTTSSAVSGGAGGYQLDSFFDVFTEVSTDGGNSYYPSVAGPATVTLRPHGPSTPLTITCSTNISVTTVNPSGAVVDYTVTVAGGCPPIITNSVPPSGSMFPIGITAVNCSATDACSQVASCSFTVTVSPLPLGVTCPSNITVRATSLAGAVVNYTVTTSGGCPLITLICLPPSGSTFPIGTTTVACTATDACGQQATCSFTVTVLRLLNKSFFKQSLLPPTNGVFVPPTPVGVTFPGGIIVSNIAHGLFSTGFVPPLTTGGSLTKSFTSQVQVDISFDYGATWHSCVVSNVPVTVGITNIGTDSGDILYGTELTQLDISGGTLPAGVRIRESQTKASLGQTRIETTAGGYQIDSFFDIYLEVSTDFGGTYFPANSACTVQVKPDPALILAVPVPLAVLPMPNGQYISPTAWHQLYANGIVIKDVRHKLFTGWMEPPLFGATQTHTFDSQLDFQLSTDGGYNFTAARAPATMTVSINNVRGFQGRSTYETEVTQLDVAGGDLPAGVLIRESQTKASKGGTSMLAGGGGGGAGGGAAISSFFDIYTEVSTDSGGVWGAATNGPAHMELRPIAPVYVFTNNLLPPSTITSRYISQPLAYIYYANGIVITNVIHGWFYISYPPPAPGLTDIHTFNSQMEFDFSQDDGLTFTHANASATVTVQITGRLGGDGITEYYDTEMTQLDISGGSLPQGVYIRESPVKASLGRTTITEPLGAYQIDSFFDIFTEVSTDGGNSWYPAISGPHPVKLRDIVTLGVQPITNGIQLKWTPKPDTIMLLQAPTVTGPWVPISGATSPYMVMTSTSSVPCMFYRLIVEQ